MRRSAFAGLGLLASAICVGLAPMAQAVGAQDFDFYVLALSWSPSYCESEGSQADPQQCKSSKPLGFVVHGLWPQREHGYSAGCESPQGDLPRSLVRSLSDVFPSPGLARHEWRAHGACSGLDPQNYFALVRQAREKISVPAAYRRVATPLSPAPNEIENAFTRANPGLTADGLAVACSDGLMREVRICLTKELDFRPCPEVDRRGCRQNRVEMPPQAN